MSKKRLKLVVGFVDCSRWRRRGRGGGQSRVHAVKVPCIEINGTWVTENGVRKERAWILV